MIICQNTFGRNVLFGVMDTSLVSLGTLAKIPFKNIFKHKEIRAYIP